MMSLASLLKPASLSMLVDYDSSDEDDDLPMSSPLSHHQDEPHTSSPRIPHEALDHYAPATFSFLRQPMIRTSNSDWDISLAMSFGMLKPRQEGRQYSKWHLFLQSSFMDMCSVYPSGLQGQVDSLVGFSFFTTQPHFQLPAVSALGGWSDDAAIDKALEADRAANPGENISRTRAASSRIPDITRQLIKITITRDDDQGILYRMQSRTLMIVEIKPMEEHLSRAAKRRVKLKARRQAYNQAQHVFDEDPILEYLGIMVACGEQWMFFEQKRKNTRPAAWENDEDPIGSVDVTPEGVVAREAARRNARPRYEPLPWADPDYEDESFIPSSDSIEMEDTRLLRHMTRAEAKAAVARRESDVLVQPMATDDLICPNFLRHLLPVRPDGDLHGGDDPFFVLRDPAGVSVKAMACVVERLEQRNSDICASHGFVDNSTYADVQPQVASDPDAVHASHGSHSDDDPAGADHETFIYSDFFDDDEPLTNLGDDEPALGEDAVPDLTPTSPPHAHPTDRRGKWHLDGEPRRSKRIASNSTHA
ncbi:hypothetical protein EIP91_001933 [Steccherinum ochraceum]|uniref:Uncharacterized protein n=1 Tax=Steccherinum ochraceum TaxID=92696 RepID=A0A4R0RFH9_9APHY|nr:hypothetical protein EIP91_001933 [Steccherinum ochraceum]